ncbi:MAG TPA: RNA-dependent DNA polymerase, partial [Ruminococcaceae bacterium]|nr:RNA-dependent DNA polymerase [Oscillospiraceae bacterium]
MTFSADISLYPVFKRAKDMLENTGFELNENKTRFINSNNRQSVTGITVNEGLSVSADYKHRLRQEVYYALKYGLTDSI